MAQKRISEYGVWQELRVIRTKDGQSLAELSRTSGISLGYLSDLEGGHRWPNPTQVKKVALALNCPVSVLERTRSVTSDGESVALRELIRDVVREVLDERAVEKLVVSA
ncbi:helix-turn-helix transcriptional regulator [Mycobacteroides abscessus subsp. abscessus]|uniref:XRE family transcriptional regulator n=2 Tax=root TaxID=1 RepID=A0A9Q7SL72_9MYCO|nr:MULTISPECIES: helix-turn-helix transcriptional regulator [Mycobacteroides]YP_010050664.1 helix-turn-helix transcriptional regulator [Mycobacterium phage phiT46-1]QSM02838.1 helix-turn-helix DNA binding protein [Mycobacterium phage prophi58-1]QSM03132.1 helix-turn-helix DNA binding protein [Mycobacterium phage prophiGD24-2]QSM03466.1 helix-turn-helix DNA binding protein [Mycobacterium phage prophiGD21-3]WJJ56714.1 helix-turn-helix DNA binding protein [Mycobacterium phage prophiT46-1]MBN7400